MPHHPPLPRKAASLPSQVSPLHQHRQAPHPLHYQHHPPPPPVLPLPALQPHHAPLPAVPSAGLPPHPAVLPPLLPAPDHQLAPHQASANPPPPLWASGIWPLSTNPTPPRTARRMFPGYSWVPRVGVRRPLRRSIAWRRGAGWWLARTVRERRKGRMLVCSMRRSIGFLCEFGAVGRGEGGERLEK
jgi:hypothetical protein